MAINDLTTNRIKATFARVERQGLKSALWVRLITLLIVQAWLIIAVPKYWTLFYHFWIVVFLALGATQLFLIHRASDARWQPYVFAIVDGVLLAVVLLISNPLWDEAWPPAMLLRYANIVFVFVFLAGAAFSYNPGLVLCTGLSSMIVWRFGVFLLASREGAISSDDEAWLNAGSMDETIRLLLDPEFIHLNMQNKKVFAVLLVTGLLALVVSRARRLVLSQVTIERARTNLARYFSPNLVDQLAAQDQPLGAVRRQSVAVLFADIQGFTTMSENMAPEEVVNLLRGFHERMETAIFAHQGTLDKYIGDGLMATFGTPLPGDLDATNALAAARRMFSELELLNQERVAADNEVLKLSIGIHYGTVVQGDIGGGQRLEFTVLGDTVNVAARLESMTRRLETRLAISQDMIDRLKVETDTPDLSGLVESEPQTIRGRIAKLGIWTLA
ncbi:MAG: adenylate/guanylate cyclase domain-containing protein [Geminicoccales bacterium]